MPQVRNYRTRVLPIAAFYGANASGKSNFFQALQFASKLVVPGVAPDSAIPVVPLLLDRTSGQKPSRFHFELLIDEKIYELSFAVTRKEVVEEKLVVIDARTETTLYDRRGGGSPTLLRRWSRISVWGLPSRARGTTSFS
ncbi:protein of unknown function [Methylacidimicrobium sp. AP8]|uniref:AAA family ATPase n=1 Tax=Methylacidimicrobium sp. AP8 TaxID=2730359 RepID=UPI0018C0CFED|nr:AAA family ATPase [Methylacidimicrobium sp. AP8]CAB4244079.1 protein of unknown function [Methylacidimicrobium sp. AP8]